MDITIEQPAQGRLITADEQELPAAATFRYTSADPLAVHIDFPPEIALDGDLVTWTFARALLEAGLRGPAGGGDVHLWPCGRARTGSARGSRRAGALQFDTSALRRVLLHTYAVVAVGQEDVGAEVERGLTALFGAV